ncbi:phosphotransferase, partial [Candidatus Parcubacteria bacterium]|nr:phosphotransferase [Candidatus Parcubacteria bacterium]
LELHDDNNYFQRNIFALKNLKTKEIFPSQIYFVDKKRKIIFREYLKGNFASDLILKKVWKEKELKRFITKSAKFAAFLHNFKFKKKPKFLLTKINQKIEKIILSKTLEFIKPNIENLRPTIERNLRLLFQKMRYLERINEKCLIHGDYQVANFIFDSQKRLRVMDFDTVEFGNPARDLGRFLAQLESIINSKTKRDSLENLFLNVYLKMSKRRFFPDLNTNLNVYKAEMIQYMILGKIWEDEIPSPKEIKNLLDYQTLLLTP